METTKRVRAKRRPNRTKALRLATMAEVAPTVPAPEPQVQEDPAPVPTRPAVEGFDKREDGGFRVRAPMKLKPKGSLAAARAGDAVLAGELGCAGSNGKDLLPELTYSADQLIERAAKGDLGLVREALAAEFGWAHGLMRKAVVEASLVNDPDKLRKLGDLACRLGSGAARTALVLAELAPKEALGDGS